MTSAHMVFDEVSTKVAQRLEGMRSSAVRDLFAAASRSDIISLSGGMPDVSLLPAEVLEQASYAALHQLRSQALQYSDTAGLASVRSCLSTLMRDVGIRAQASEILITQGAQEALDLLAKTFINPGDIIITEGPTYLGALQAFSAYQPYIICIPFDEDGMRMDLLEAELKKLGKGAVKFLYTIPNFQNPGGVTLSSERRDALLSLSETYDFLIVEDDPYGRLRYQKGHIKPLRARSNKVLYLGTVSKVFAPGLRLGWLIAPEYVIKKVNLMKQGTDLCGSALTQLIVEHYFTQTSWEKTLQTFIKTYAERRDAMIAALEEYFPQEACWTNPEGGFFVWVELPSYVDLSSMLARALDSGVIYTPGDGFYPDGVRGKNCMRLAFCYESPENIREAIRRLAEVLDERLELYRAFMSAGALGASEGALETAPSALTSF